MRVWVLLMCGFLAGCAAPPGPREWIPASEDSRASSAKAPDPAGLARLTVEDAVRLALEHNLDLQVQRLEPDAAAVEVERARAAFGGALFAGSELGEQRSSETARSTGEQFGVEAEERESELGVRKVLSTGTEVELALREQRDASNRAPEQQEVRAELDLTQSLLRGRSRKANWAEVRQAEIGEAVSREELRGYVQALLASIETAYWQLHLARKTTAITEQALAVAEQQRDDINTRIEVGDLPRNEAAAALAEVARRRQVLIEAQAEQEIRRLEFLSLIAPTRYDAQPELLTPVAIPASPITNAAAHVARALEQRPDLREAEGRAEQQRLEVIRTRNGLLPRLDFFAGLAKTGFGENLSDAVDDLEEDTYEWRVGLRLLQEIGARETRADAVGARVRQEQALIALDNLRLRIGLEVRQALAEVERAREQLTASAETRHLQEATLQAERERFEVGSSTALLVAQAQRDLLTSQINEQRAKVQYRIALISLEVAEGSLPARRGIDIEDPAF